MPIDPDLDLQAMNAVDDLLAKFGFVLIADGDEGLRVLLTLAWFQGRGSGLDCLREIHDRAAA